MKGKQYTIRGIPEKLDAVLREEAAATGKSLNTVLIDKLNQSCRLTDEPQTNGLEKFIGTWVEDPEFDEAMEECNRIHPDEWPELKAADDGPPAS